jgi:UDP-glucose 4-epimerase
MYDLIKKLERDVNQLEILGTGLQRKDYVYIDDAIDAFLLAYHNAVPGEAYNVGSGTAITVNEIASLICQMMDVHPTVFYTGGKSWEGDVESTQADISSMRSFGWLPQIDIKTGIQLFYSWMKT